jgi:hypothetical protein
MNLGFQTEINVTSTNIRIPTISWTFNQIQL